MQTNDVCLMFRDAGRKNWFANLVSLGFLFMNRSPASSPALMQVEFFNAAGNVVRTVSNTGRSLAVNVFCRKGVWTVASSDTSSATFLPISSVSCAQTGSTGADKGYIIGQAVN
ncbi:hypothetical protein Y032_0056g2685 [Ancylostoma ceylanicum]|nr:hypothetical protein Y032_0056g2685 [Ancylostoma ceylanicum]